MRLDTTTVQVKISRANLTTTLILHFSGASFHRSQIRRRYTREREPTVGTRTTITRFSLTESFNIITTAAYNAIFHFQFPIAIIFSRSDEVLFPHTIGLITIEDFLFHVRTNKFTVDTRSHIRRFLPLFIAVVTLRSAVIAYVIPPVIISRRRNFYWIKSIVISPRLSLKIFRTIRCRADKVSFLFSIILIMQSRTIHLDPP